MHIHKATLKHLAIFIISACLFVACGKDSNNMGNNNMTNLDATSQQTVATAVTTMTPAHTAPPTTAPIATPAVTSTPASASMPTPTSTPTPTPTPAPTPSTFADMHGALRVEGVDLVDQNGEKVQLYGMSTHGIAWYPQYVCYDSFKTLRDDWNTNCVRLAMYTQETGGYCADGDKEALKALVKNGVDTATQLGMYVIIDWHILSDQDPHVHKDEASAFFREMSSHYADHTNVLYEICNEPNGYATWDSVKSYANEVIPVIRENDDDAVIIVGSPTWSQDIHLAAQSPLEYDNIMYSLHFYAGTHKDDLRNRVETCVTGGLPVFISEFGMCDASGNGANDFDSASKWMELIEKYNVSFFCWNLANKDESSSVFKASSVAVSDWTEADMNESGKWIREYFRSK